MLHLIFGRSGFGKTHEVLDIAKIAAEESKDAVIIVPEQFTFETERTIIHDFGEKSINIEVLSFQRLVHRVMSIYGGLAERYIDDCGRNVLMKLTLSEIKDMLKVYSKQALSPAFVKTMVTAVSEYKICAIEPDMIEETAKKSDNSLLREKLSDISLIMRTYCAKLESEFSDPLDDLTRLANKLADCPFFNGKTVIIDGFKGFTPQERKVIGEIFKSADDVYVALCTESLGSSGSSGLFSPVEKTARQLLMLCDKCGVTASSIKKLSEPHRFENETLKYLESSVFRPDAKEFNKDAPELCLVSANNVYDEVQFAACEITKIVREENCRFKDITVISRGTDLYDGVLDTVFEKYGIPIFMDLRRKVATHPLMALVLSLMSILTDNFRQENVLRYLKTGIAGFTTLEVSELENYMLMWDIRGEEMWSSPWVNSPSGFENKTDKTQEELESLNSLRKRFYEPIKQLRDNFEKMNCAAALYKFLCDCKISEAVNDACRELKEKGEIRLSNEYSQIFEELISMLDQIYLASKNSKLSPADFASMLSLVIENTDLGSIPPSLDGVCAGDAERIRTDGAKYVFVLGLAEGVFPKSQTSGGLITETERRALIDLGLELSPPAAEKSAEERFYAYKAFTCASKKVYLSYPRSDSAGKTLRPSYFLLTVKSLFPKLSLTDTTFDDPLLLISNKRTAFDLFASNYNSDTPFSAALKDVFNSFDEYRLKREAIERAAKGGRLEFSNPATAKRLYGDDMRVSPSRIETFRQCKFLYFCRYGIGAKPRKKAELDAPQIGTVIHFVLEKLLKKTSGDLSSCTHENLDEMTKEILNEFAEVYLGGLENKPERFRYIFRSLSETVLCLVEHMAEEFAQSGFKPCDYELEIASDGQVKPFEILLDDGAKLIVGGKIDRVDTMKIKDKTYIRVIDYKTGSKNFNLSDIVYGLNLQMFIYLFTLCKNGGERYADKNGVIPAGVLYYPAKKPDVMATRGEESEKIESDAESELRMKGIVLNEPDVIFGMESSGNGKFIPAQIKSSIDDDGTISYAVSGRSSVASLEQFGILRRHIEKLLKQMAKTIRAGDAAAIPVKGCGYDPCKYCDYSCVCGFEQGSKTDNLYTIEKDNVFDKLKGDESNAD